MQALASIPAMTTDAERECYYRLTTEAIGKGAIVEFGAWLGASTAYIAAAIRDSGEPIKAQVYDKFQSKPGHAKKVRAFYAKKGMAEIPLGDALDEFKANLGPLLAHVEPHRCMIENARWDGSDIALIVTDAPKRVAAISAVLTNFRSGLRPGTVMAWQDFCHFPSYEIPACLYRLRWRFEFVEAVVPGTTLVFRINTLWEADEVTPEALALSTWAPAEIDAAWDCWLAVVPDEKAALFRCGKAMFLCDIGYHAKAVAALDEVLREGHAEVMSKWQYLRASRPDFLVRYAPLFECLVRHERKAA